MILFTRSSDGWTCREFISTYCNSSELKPWSNSLVGGMPIHISKPVRGAVEHPDERIRDVVENGEGYRHPQRDRLGAANGEIFRHELAEDDFEERDSREGQAVGDRHHGRVAESDTHVGQRTFNGGGDERLAHPAETEAGQRDAELRGGQVTIQVFGDAQRDAEPPVLLALDPHGLELRLADFDEGKLGRHEKGVGHDKPHDEQRVRGKIKP